MSKRYEVEELKRLALRLREHLRMKDILHLDMLGVLETMKTLIPGFDYKRVSDSEVKDGEGLYDSELPYLRIPDATFEALKRNEPRARFTCAHEIGHWVLDHEGQRFRRAERKAYEQSKPSIRRDEREAEQFAAFFLAPDHLAESFSTISDLQTRFGLSRPAAEIRKRELDVDARRKRGEPRPLPNSIIDFLEQARAKGYRVTSLRNDPKQPRQITPQNTPKPTSARAPSTETEICGNCGNCSMTLNGLEMVCSVCGKRLAL